FRLRLAIAQMRRPLRRRVNRLVKSGRATVKSAAKLASVTNSSAALAKSGGGGGAEIVNDGAGASSPPMIPIAWPKRKSTATAYRARVTVTPIAKARPSEVHVLVSPPARLPLTKRPSSGNATTASNQ